MLVDPHDRAVHHCDKDFRGWAPGQLGHDPVPGPISSPPVVPPPQRGLRPELGRHIPPRGPRPQPPANALHRSPVITPRAAPLGPISGRQWLVPGPHRITELRTPRHTPSIHPTRPPGYATRPRNLAYPTSTRTRYPVPASRYCRTKDDWRDDWRLDVNHPVRSQSDWGLL